MYKKVTVFLLPFQNLPLTFLYEFYMFIHMETVQSSLSLTKTLDEKVRALAKERGQTKNSLLQEAIRTYIERIDRIELEGKMQAIARSMGLNTEDDVVEFIHSVRKEKALKKS